MNVAVFGLGYVGAITAACLANDGHTVVGVDVNDAKVAGVNAGRAPVSEPGLEELISRQLEAGRLTATTDPDRAVAASDTSMVCVGTPSATNGSPDHAHVETVASQIGEALARSDGGHVVCVRSTILPGTLDSVVVPALEHASGRELGTGFGVCSNPEFLREGNGIADYYHPSFVVIGAHDPATANQVARLYDRVEAPVYLTPVGVAELVKYASNAFHALKITFANEVGALAKREGVDGRDVMELLCRDSTLNISPVYLRPGFAFGGSCLPKDVRALTHRARRRDLDIPLLGALLPSNERHLQRAIELVEAAGSTRIGVVGLSFKAGTDDVRESPSVALVETLLGRGHEIAIYDEHVDPANLVGQNRAFLERELPHVARLLRPTIEDVVAESDVLVLTNGSASSARIAELKRPSQRVIDLAGALDRELAGEMPAYEGICW